MSLITLGWIGLAWVVFSTVLGSLVGRCIATPDLPTRRDDDDSRGR